MSPPPQALLYGIVDLGYIGPESAERVAASLIVGGAKILQFRAKGRPIAEIRELARRLQLVCRAADVPLIINDHPRLAADVGADGLHLGQDDGELAETRRIVGPDLIMGRSTHSPEQARHALAEGFDYIGFGPLFPTPTKLGRPGIGLSDIATVEDEVGRHIPVFCIGGINRVNLPRVLDAGARRTVIVSDLLTAPDIAAATREAMGLLSAPGSAPA